MNDSIRIGSKVSYTKEASRRSIFSGTITLVGVVTKLTKKTVTINNEYVVPRERVLVVV